MQIETVKITSIVLADRVGSVAKASLLTCVLVNDPLRIHLTTLYTSS
jgi:hypothetical protein